MSIPRLLSAVLLLLTGTTAARAEPRLVVLVRHAETQSDGTRDPGLSEEGRARAEALAASLAEARVTAVVTSTYRRTKETAAPTATAFELTPTAAPITREGGLAGHVTAVVEAVRAAPGGVVLVVGHGNTVPRVVEALGGPNLPDLDESDHATVFTLALEGEAGASLLRTELAAAPPVPWDVNDPCPGVEFPPQESSPYVLPYPVGVTRNVRQGNCNATNSHHAGYGEPFAYDFEMPIGSEIVAARGGRVLAVIEEFTDEQNEMRTANLVAIDHGDGTYAKYGHLTHDGALVEVGEEVKTGQPIARSGNSGMSRGPHLHFSVKRCPEGERVGGPRCESIPVSFRNTRPHPRGLIGSATSEIGEGERYEALAWKP